MNFEPSDYSVDDRGVVQLSRRLRDWVDNTDGFYRHWLHHVICKDVYQQSVDGSAPVNTSSDLAARGISLLPNAVPEDHCNTLTEFMDRETLRHLRRRDAADHTTINLTWSHRSGAALRQALPDIIAPSITQQIETYYGSHFQILSVSVTRYFPDLESCDSFLWHRDHEPPQQAHMITYLSGASDQRGTTQILDLETSRRAAIAGYAYPEVENRKADLAKVLGEPVDDAHVTKPNLEAGGTVIFGAPRLLHRAVRPIVDHRDTLLLIFIPSPIPWTDRLDHNFASILRHEANYNSGFIDPFDNFSPTRNHGNAPEWAKRGDMAPPEEELAIL